MNRDEEHLRLLAIFHYIVAGLTGLMSMIPLVHVAMGLFLIFGSKYFKDQNQSGPSPAVIGMFFIVIACVFIVLGLTMAALILINGRCIAKRRHYTFCQVMSGVECLLMPLGTALGVITLIVLSRESVRPLFGLSPSAPGQPRF
jgi:hypothetical protein